MLIGAALFTRRALELGADAAAATEKGL